MHNMGSKSLYTHTLQPKDGGQAKHGLDVGDPSVDFTIQRGHPIPIVDNSSGSKSCTKVVPDK